MKVSVQTNNGIIFWTFRLTISELLLLKAEISPKFGPFFFEFRAPYPPLMRTRGTATTPRRLQIQSKGQGFHFSIFDASGLSHNGTKKGDEFKNSFCQRFFRFRGFLNTFHIK